MILASLFLLFIILLLVIGLSVFVKAIHRQEDEMETENLSEKQKEWLSKFGELNDKAGKLAKNCPSEMWHIQSFDGLKLAAEFYPVKDSHRYAICIHGYTNGRKSMRRYGAVFHSWGFQVLLPDNRAHGDSEGKWVGMGYLDAKDVLKWINHIVEKDSGAQIFLLGVSMGGATVMMSSALDLPSSVKFLVEDCGYSSVWEEFKVQVKKMHLPVFPFLYIASFWCKLFAGYSFQEASSLKALEKNKLPILFIHGEKDKFVPYSMLDENVGANHTTMEVYRVPDAGHSLSAAYGRETYFRKIKNFVDQYMS